MCIIMCSMLPVKSAVRTDHSLVSRFLEQTAEGDDRRQQRKVHEGERRHGLHVDGVCEVGHIVRRLTFYVLYQSTE